MLLQFIETSLHIVRTKWYEKTQRKFAHLEGGQGQTFRFTLCPLVEMVLLCFTQWQNYSCWQGPPEAQPWSQPDCSELHLSLLGCETVPGRRWPNLPGSCLRGWAIFMGKKAPLYLQSELLMCQLVLQSSCYTLLWRAWLHLLHSLPSVSGILLDAPEVIPSPSWSSLGPTASPCRVRTSAPLSQWSPQTVFAGGVSVYGPNWRQ